MQGLFGLAEESEPETMAPPATPPGTPPAKAAAPGEVGDQMMVGAASIVLVRDGAEVGRVEDVLPRRVVLA